MEIKIKPIGIIHSPYNEKFIIPRQPALNKVVKAQIELLPPYNCKQAISGLEQVSHLWLSFLFHQVKEEDTRLMVRPPRLGGNIKVGVLASRSPFRVNRMGLSVVKLEKIIISKKGYFLEFSGVDMLDKTPVLDIKPYLKYADCIDDASLPYAQALPEKVFQVLFSKKVKPVLQSCPELEEQLTSILCFDPRPAYKHNHDGRIAFLFQKWNIQAQITSDKIVVDSITPKTTK